ncbi:MAG: hypothetical protein Kilf2KO_39080 [Rhodospirillales bacterium]
MRVRRRLHALGLWFAGLAIGIKVVLAAFAAAPLHQPSFQPANLFADGTTGFVQIICTGSGFLMFEESESGETKITNLSHCPLCVAAATLLLGSSELTLLGLLAFIALLTALTGVDRPRKIAPRLAGFRSRAPPRPFSV